MTTRIRLEAALGCLSAVLCLLTLAWKDWIEGVFGWDPDRHNGAMEWLIVVGTLAAALLFGGMAARDRRRLVALASQEAVDNALSDRD